MQKYIFEFSKGEVDGDVSMKNVLGGKGANLAEMSKIGLPVPPGFTISTEVCNYYYENDKKYPVDFDALIDEAIAKIEKKLNLKFGDVESQPLLLSVRSGSRVSMPGMMDTILNLGLNDQTVAALAKSTNNERFAYDSYRRFIQMYGDVVMNVPHYYFEEIIELARQDEDVYLDSQLSVEALKQIVRQFKKQIQDETGVEFPTNVKIQLKGAINAVFDSWMNPRAVTYRRHNEICASFGTAVNVQSMVFGNMGEDSATGVAFTRDPSTGEKFFYGEYLTNAQGEDVVAGIRTPMPINEEMLRRQKSTDESAEEIANAMSNKMPQTYQELVKMFEVLENHYCDMQDVEFTIQNGKLWLLQTRSGKRTAQAALKIAVNMVEEGVISKKEACLRIDPAALEQLLHPRLDPNAKYEVSEVGLPASPGAASGMVVFSSDDAEELAQKGESVILVRVETSPEDIHGMYASNGILTSRGGMTSHAAVVARGMGKCCIVGAGGLDIDYEKNIVRCRNGKEFKKHDIITINGSNGEIILANVKKVDPSFSDEFAKIMRWSAEFKKLQIRTNAETKRDAEVAVKFGAEGIGLCRTEHMFFEEDRIMAVREMIIASDELARKKALEKILPMQKKDFIDLFNVMGSFPVNIRLLDPPLHEFLPNSEKEIDNVAKTLNVSVEALKLRMNQLHEFNPMLGNRGCRLGICYPEIYECQARAIFEALAEVVMQTNSSPNIEIMVPLIFSGNELKIMREKILAVADKIERENNVKLSYQIGTMIELPRAAIMSGEIAHHADYFSYGTNDLTQTSFGISRDDSASFMPKYVSDGVYDSDPFVKLDQDGVGELIKISAERGRKVKTGLKLGICGEHGGEPSAIEFFNDLSFDYVSCSPYRVPIAILAAARAEIKSKMKK